MVKVETPLSVHSSAERAFEFVADLRHEAEWNPNTHAVEPRPAGPIGVGTVFRVQGRVMGRESCFDVRIVRYQPPHLVSAVVESLPLQITYTYTVEPSEDGVKILHSAEIEPRGMMKLMAPFVGQIFRNQFDLVFPKLKEALERGS